MRATPPHCRAHTGPPRRPCASGPSPSMGSPCVTFLIRLPEVPRQADTPHARHRAHCHPANPRRKPLGHSSALSSSIVEFHLPWWSTAPGTCHVSTSEPLSDDFRRTFDVNHAAGLPHRCSAQGKATRRHQPDPTISPTANPPPWRTMPVAHPSHGTPPRGTPSPRHSERGRRNATAPQHPGRHPPAIHRPTVTAPPCRRNQG